MISPLVALLALLPLAPPPSAVARSRAYWENYGTCSRTYTWTHTKLENGQQIVVPGVDGDGLYGEELGAGITGTSVVCSGTVAVKQSWFLGDLEAKLTNGSTQQDLSGGANGVKITFYVQGEIKNGGVYAQSQIGMTLEITQAFDESTGHCPPDNAYAPAPKSCGLVAGQVLSMAPGSTLIASGSAWGYANTP